MKLIDIDAEVERIMTFVPARYPVLNQEPRVLMSPRKWHLIWERDGNSCWLCMRVVPKGAGEIDHLTPRSSFAIEDLAVADRSDNLRVACVDCNQEKSNYSTLFQPRRIGVTPECADCARWQDEADVLAYCGRCGLVSRVPDEGWLL